MEAQKETELTIEEEDTSTLASACFLKVHFF